MVKVRLQRCLVDGRVGSFCCFPSPALCTQLLSAVSLLITAGAAKKAIFSFQMSEKQSRHYSPTWYYTSLCVVKAHARTLMEQFT